MKNTVLLSLIAIVFSVQGQQRTMPPQHLLEQKVKMENPVLQEHQWINPTIPYKQVAFPPSVMEEEIGDTRYDNQSNASIPKKIVLFDDGTIGATWTRSMEEGSFFADRGTGYNYFDGTAWGEWPSARVEDMKVHRPVYARWGANGEMIVTHTSGQGLYMATRPEKGTGDWDFETIPGPPDEDYILWARAVTSGPDHERVHLLSMTLPSSHNGTPYQGLDGALLYSMSLDGGQSWDIEHEILEGMTSDDYSGFAGDTYAFAEPVGDVVAFVVGDPWTGLFLMKSTDGGFTFEKTVIWEHPYPDWQWGTPTDTFYCADGAHSLVVDNDGLVHVVFGVTRMEADDEGTYWYKWVDGVAYWNEDMPAFSDDLNALCPYPHPDSELIEDYNLVAWSQDVDGNGQLDFLDDIGLYFIGLSSMPQLVIDEDQDLYLVYSSVTEGFSNGLKNYRHIWTRKGIGAQYWGSFSDLTGDLVHIFDECVYPAAASNSDDKIHLIYQADNEPGTAVWAQQHEYVDNRTVYLNFEKNPLIGYPEVSGGAVASIQVGQNIPNPFDGNTTIAVENFSPGDLTLTVTDLSGKILHEWTIPEAGPGIHTFDIHGSAFASGMYFYSVSDGNSMVVKKMIVE